MITIPVKLPATPYDVRIGRLDPAQAADALVGAFGKITGLAILADERVLETSPHARAIAEALRAKVARAALLPLPAGEACKDLATVGRTCEWLARSEIDRGGAIVGVGGGAATDHAGFAAAVYLRGVRFASVPTTLLAMVDASVGGKTGVDLQAGKNLVGAFHQPRAVLADLAFLDTLPEREFRAGLAEVVKAALIADAELWDTLESHVTPARWPEELLAQVIAAAVRVKAEVVAEDERESGRRAILNFGHTVGHAIEAASNYQLLHGEAVALGMIAALAFGVARDVTPAPLLARTRALLDRLGLPTDVVAHLSDRVVSDIDVDKKRRSHNVRFVFVTKPGEAVVEELPLTELRAQLLRARAYLMSAPRVAQRRGRA